MSELAKSKNQKNTKKTASSSFSPAVIITICVAVAILAGVIVWSLIERQNNNPTNKVVMRIGDTEIKGSEYAFYYNNTISTFQEEYSSVISYLGVDFTKDLSTQETYEGSTWADYFRNSAESSIIETTLLYNEAVANGYELTSEEKSSVDSELNTLANAIKSLGVGVDYYLQAAYGEGVTAEVYKNIRYKSLLGNKYLEALAETYDYTDEECENYYAENRLSLDTATFRSYIFKYTVPDDDETGDESYKNEAKASAEAMLEAISDEASFEKYVFDNVLTDEDKESVYDDFTLSENAKYSTLNTDVGDWIFDTSRVAGDKTVIEANNAFNVIYFISCGLDRYNTAEIRYIYIKAEEEEHDDSEEGSHEAAETDALAKAHEKAETIYNEWKSGDATAESFGDLAITYSDDSSASNGGLIKNVYKGSVDELDNWIFDSRNPGDCAVIDSEYGSYIVYYVQDNEPYWMLSVKSTLANNEYSDYLNELKSNTEILLDEETAAKIAK